MKILMLVLSALLFVPALRAQQLEDDKGPSQPVQLGPSASPNQQHELSDSIKPGHPLDPADVDILTGKRDREIAESERNAAVVVGGYGGYSSGPFTNTRRESRFGELPFLPLRRFGGPFFFSSIVPRNFGGRSFRIAR